MVQGDVDLEGITFRSSQEQDLFVAGQRERAIADRAMHPVVKKEAKGKARGAFIQSCKSTRER